MSRQDFLALEGSVPMTVPLSQKAGEGQGAAGIYQSAVRCFGSSGKAPGARIAGASRVLGAKGVYPKRDAPGQSQRRKGRSSYSSSRIAEGAPTYIDPPGRLPHRGTNRRFRALEPAPGSGATRELHVYDHASGMIALLFREPEWDGRGFRR